MMIETTRFTVIFILSTSIVFAVDPCRFEYPGKGVIDLTTVGHSDGTAAFVDKIPVGQPAYKYSYNPCKPFSGPSVCQNVAACQTTVNDISSYNLGSQESATWDSGSETGDSPTITYSTSERKTIVRLACSTNASEEFEALGEGPTSVYLFRLTHRCACWDGCWSPPPSTTTTLPTTTPVVNSCRFTDPEYGIIDLTSVGRTDGIPAYADRIPVVADGFKFSYNPCKPFTQGSVCKNVAACRISTDGEDMTILGTQESVIYYSPGGITDYPTIRYQYDDYMAYVMLVCSSTEMNEFDIIDEEGSRLYLFRLVHKCACWNACSSTTTTIAPTSTRSQPTTDACRFVHPEKGVIDFSFIGRTDEKAAYSDETTRTVSNFKYSYNPCRSFSQGADCIGVSVCQISNNGQETLTLGTQESAWWDAGSDINGAPSVNYVYADKKVSVVLQCSNEGNNEFQAFGEDPVNTFKFQLTHKCACWNGCSNV